MATLNGVEFIFVSLLCPLLCIFSISVFNYLFHFNFQSYASILYLRLPPGFRVILRGKDVEHHNIVNDMMLSQEVIYRPQPSADVVSKNLNVIISCCITYSCVLLNMYSYGVLQQLSSDGCCRDYWIC